MKNTKVAQFGNIPAGTLVWLTEEQARARGHAITEVDTDKTRKDRKLYSADQQLGFKAGEELAIEGDLDRGLQAMFGLDEASAGNSDEKADQQSAKPTKPTDAALRKAFKEGQDDGAHTVLSALEGAIGHPVTSVEDRRKGEGLNPTRLTDLVAAAKAEGRAEMFGEVEAYNQAVDALDAAEEDLANVGEDGKAAAQKRVDDARVAIEALPELKA